MMQTKPHKSPAWFKNFQKVKDNVVRCEICGAELSYRGFTLTAAVCCDVTKGDGPDANHQTSSYVNVWNKRLREKTNVTSLIANIVVKDMLSVVYIFSAVSL